MGKNFLLILSLGILFFKSLTCSEDFDAALKAAEDGFQKRWNKFKSDKKDFPLWSFNLNDTDLKIRFEEIYKGRYQVYLVNHQDYKKPKGLWIYNDLYEIPKDFSSWGSKLPYPYCFSYNLATENYSASIITIDGKMALALEAPNKENLPAFKEVLKKCNVTDLVRLTPSMGKYGEDCFPYWEGNININTENGRNTIHIDEKEINYFFTDRWVDYDGTDPKRLLAFVKAVISNKPQIVAVHCKAGIGRTGVFLASYFLIQEINEQFANGIPLDKIQISIDKIVWELSLQRQFMVGNEEQYITLYKLVDLYINN